MKKSLKLGLALVFSISVLLVISPMTAHATAPSVWIVNSADDVYDGSAMPADPVTFITLYAAKGEYEAVQICVRNNNGSDITVNSITLSNLTSGGNTISSSNTTIRREYIHTNVSVMGGALPNNDTPPSGSTGYADALVDINDTLGSFNAASIAANKTGIYWYNVCVPEGQTPGTYTGSVTINTSAGNQSVNVSVTVYDVTLPATDESTIAVNNWAFATGWDTSWYGEIYRAFGYTDFSADWWTVVENMADNLAEHRNNVILVDAIAFLQPDVYIDSNQNVTFDWDKFDQYVQTFIDAGAGQYMKMYGCFYFDTPNSIAYLLALRNVNGNVVAYNYPAGSDEAEYYLDQYFTQLKAHLEYMTQYEGWPEWRDFLYMNGGDEAWLSWEWEGVNWFYDFYHEYFPDGKCLEAGVGTTQFGTSVTGYCPQVNDSYTYEYFYQTQAAAGLELWNYVCCNPQGSYMNRYISQPLSQSRLMFLDYWEKGATGYLHWGWDFWNGHTAQGTFDDSIDGDAFIVYPNTTDKTVYDSVRYEAQLDGLEDYELLNILAQTDAVAAQRIVDSLIVNGTDYTRSGADITAAHKAVLDAIVLSGDPDAIAYSAYLDDEFSMTDTSSIFEQLLSDCAVGSNFTVNFDAKINSVNGGVGNAAWMGCVIRGLDDTIQTGYLIGVRNTGYIFIWRTNAYVTSEVAVPGYTAGQFVNIKVVVDGNNIKVYAGNGTNASTSPLIDYTDTSSVFTTGNVGLATGWTNSTFRDVTVSQGTNYALEATVTTSSSHEGDYWSGEYAVDGQRSSVAYTTMGWSSESTLGTNHTEWIEVDLGQSRTISRVDLYPRNDSGKVGDGFPVDFTIQVSNDNTNWTTVVPETGYAKPINEVQAFTFTACTARYVRVYTTSIPVISGEGQYRMQLAEIEVYNETASPEAPVMDYEYGSSVQGWTSANQVTGFGFGTGGYMSGTITGTDPYVVSPDYLDVDITTAKTIKIRLKNSTSSTIGQIFFITDADGTWNEAKKMDFTIVANDGGYTQYTIDMSSVSGWTGTLRRLRLDPNAGASSGSFSVDYIRLYSPAENPATRSTATASSALPAWPVSNCIDGSSSTAWSSAYHNGESYNEWLCLDMGSNNSIKGVRLIPRTDEYGIGRCFPVDFKIQYSTDGSSWTDVPGQFYVGYADPGASEQTFLFATPVTARYIRIYATKIRSDGLGGYYLQMAEINADK